MIEIEIRHGEQVPEGLVRRIYLLLGSNMTAILGHSGPDWRSDAEFRAWKEGVFDPGLWNGTRYIMLQDGEGLRGFLSFTAPANGKEIYLNEIQLRPGARGDGVTLRRLLEQFIKNIRALPHATVRTYSNHRNKRAVALARKMGFRAEGETERGVRLVAGKMEFLNGLSG